MEHIIRFGNKNNELKRVIKDVQIQQRHLSRKPHSYFHFIHFILKNIYYSCLKECTFNNICM